MSSYPNLAFANIIYHYLPDLVGLEACHDLAPFAPWPLYSTIYLTNWIHALAFHPDQAFSAYIYNGYSAGFRIGFNRSLTQLQSDSMYLGRDQSI